MIYYIEVLGGEEMNCQKYLDDIKENLKKINDTKSKISLLIVQMRLLKQSIESEKFKNIKKYVMIYDKITMLIKEVSEYEEYISFANQIIQKNYKGYEYSSIYTTFKADELNFLKNIFQSYEKVDYFYEFNKSDLYDLQIDEKLFNFLKLFVNYRINKNLIYIKYEDIIDFCYIYFQDNNKISSILAADELNFSKNSKKNYMFNI